MNRHTLKVAFCLTCLCAALPAQAEDFPTRPIRVLDSQGQPVSGAKADAWLINDMYFWPSDVLKRIPVITNGEGVAELRYPKRAGLGENSPPVESIKLTITHSDFCKLDVLVPIGAKDNKPYDIKLTPGVTLKLSGVDQQGSPVTEPFAIMCTASSITAPWRRPSMDRAECRSIINGNHQLLLVQPRNDDRHWFSDVLAHHFDKAQEPEVVMEDITLQPGVVVAGKLSAKVPRPVSNGRVIASQAPLPAGDSWDEKLPSLLYYASTEIRADGSFEFKSMPRTGTIQLIALCDGWVGLFDEKTPFVVGESFDVEDEDLSVELDMQKTFDAKIRVVDKQGQPVAGAKVACNPNQLFKKGGSTFLGEAFDVMPMLKSQFSATPIAEFAARDNLYEVTTDEKGMAVVRNLPRNRWGKSFTIWSTEKTSKKIVHTPNERNEGKLPEPDQNEIELDLEVNTEAK